MATVQARIKIADGQESVLPIMVPSLDEVRSLAHSLHATGDSWRGEAFGWQAEYIPQSQARPLGSRMTFTPAEFWIGESGVWFFSMAWEKGNDAAPLEHLDESGIVRS